MTYVVPTFTYRPLTNGAYGFPGGQPRRVLPVALACVHITDNNGIPPATAAQERTFANRTGSGGPSAHFYLDRNANGGIQAIDWRRFAAWSNGDVRSPKTTTPGIPAVLALRAKGFNANEAYWLEIESCGSEPTYPITDAQKDTLAYLIATASLATGLTIGRETVHAHSDLNTETRANCPTKAANVEVLLEDIIGRAVAAQDMLAVAPKQALDLGHEVMRLDALVANLTTDRDALQKDWETATDALEAFQQQQTALAEKWDTYSEEVKTRAGGILALDPPQ